MKKLIILLLIVGVAIFAYLKLSGGGEDPAEISEENAVTITSRVVETVLVSSALGEFGGDVSGDEPAAAARRAFGDVQRGGADRPAGPVQW